MVRRWAAVLPPIFLAATCIALGQQVYDDWRQLQEPVRVEVPQAASATLAAPPPAPDAPLPQPPGAFAAIVERPLFSPTRRPPAVAPAAPTPEPEEAPAPAPPPIGFTLAGVVISGGTRTALVQMQADGRLVQVPEGGDIDGWTAVTIDAQRAVFRRGDSQEELVLDYHKQVPPGEVPPPLPQRRPAPPPPAEPADNGQPLDGGAQQ
jgi:hypothetical protein